MTARELTRLATSAAGALEVEFGRAIVLGRTLAASPALRRGDIETFALQAREAADANGTSVATGDEHGRQTFNSRVARGEPINARPEPDLVRQVRERAAPFVTDLFQAPLMDRPIAAVIVPVQGAPADIAVAIGVRVDTARLERLLPEPVFGAGAFSVVLDGRGTIAGRSAGAPGEFPVQALDGLAPGRVGLIERAGAARLLAARSLIADTGWQVVVVAPEEAVAASARRAMMWLGAAGVGGLMLAVLLSVLLAAFLLRQARGLVATASAMAEGAPVEGGSRVTEVAVVRRALEAAGGAIRSRAEAQARLHAMTETASLLEQRVAERTRDLEHATGRLLQAEDEVRRRIARDLHDSTVQELVAASLCIAHARAAPAEADQALADAADALTRAKAELRTVSFLLQPPLLDECGLVVALRLYAEGVARRSGVAIIVEAPPVAPKLSRSAETALFRVVQEALANAVSHGEARNIRVRIIVHEDGLTVAVIDDGHGMMQGAHGVVSEGVGLSSMRARVRHLGGDLSIASGPSGTVVTASLPLTARVVDQPSATQADADTQVAALSAAPA
ncbi:ATP-binding protein [Roseomonas sp. CECT 9278]|uniref:ATP-binding protein n=1 Tax=Roseomonas sp. CECT 9278 TaxID=2845823 RepID=UPI001E5A58AE|nr:ATP-binding protein [Roseomonas sp. CECT 9278]